jgi:hypothetical protein
MQLIVNKKEGVLLNVKKVTIYKSSNCKKNNNDL